MTQQIPLHVAGDAGEQFANVTRKGQVTLPARLRRALGLSEGARFAISVSGSREPEIRLRRVRSIAEATYGAVPHRGSAPADLDKLRAAFEASGGREGGPRT